MWCQFHGSESIQFNWEAVGSCLTWLRVRIVRRQKAFLPTSRALCFLKELVSKLELCKLSALMVKDREDVICFASCCSHGTRVLGQLCNTSGFDYLKI